MGLLGSNFQSARCGARSRRPRVEPLAREGACSRSRRREGFRRSGRSRAWRGARPSSHLSDDAGGLDGGVLERALPGLSLLMRSSSITRRRRRAARVRARRDDGRKEGRVPPRAGLRQRALERARIVGCDAQIGRSRAVRFLAPDLEKMTGKLVYPPAPTSIALRRRSSSRNLFLMFLTAGIAGERSSSRGDRRSRPPTS